MGNVIDIRHRLGGGAWEREQERERALTEEIGGRWDLKMAAMSLAAASRNLVADPHDPIYQDEVIHLIRRVEFLADER